MHPSNLHFFPLAQPFLLALFFLLALLIAFIQVGVLGYAYERLGVDRRYIFSLLVLSLLGSYVNIPVAELYSEQVVPPQIIVFSGLPYVIPEAISPQRTIIAVNLGGALIPTLLSLYLLAKHPIRGRGLVGTAVVSLVVNLLAEPVRGVGIAVPTFVPPLVTAVVALLLSRRYAAPLAYICGSLGTLIGADLLNLGKIPKLGAPVAAIGGAGTFDGVFMTGILAVLLASVYGGRRLPAASRSPGKPF